MHTVVSIQSKLRPCQNRRLRLRLDCRVIVHWSNRTSLATPLETAVVNSDVGLSQPSGLDPTKSLFSFITVNQLTDLQFCYNVISVLEILTSGFASLPGTIHWTEFVWWLVTGYCFRAKCFCVVSRFVSRFVYGHVTFVPFTMRFKLTILTASFLL